MHHLLIYAFSMLGTPYCYGGNNKLQGLDCSGFVNEILRSTGLVGNHEDLTAQQLYDKFSINGTQDRYTPGALIFYGQSVTKIYHVAMMIDKYRIIEAGGGDHTCLTPEIAKSLGAMVRIRLIDYRKDRVAIVAPRYATIGLF